MLTGDVDATTATGRLVFGIFATVAEFERDPIHERTMAGLAAARTRGRAGGRPRVMTKPKLKASAAFSHLSAMGWSRGIRAGSP